MVHFPDYRSSQNRSRVEVSVMKKIMRSTH
jgi:hypothetical protein